MRTALAHAETSRSVEARTVEPPLRGRAGLPFACPVPPQLLRPCPCGPAGLAVPPAAAASRRRPAALRHPRRSRGRRRPSAAAATARCRAALPVPGRAGARRVPSVPALPSGGGPGQGLLPQMGAPGGTLKPPPPPEDGRGRVGGWGRGGGGGGRQAPAAEPGAFPGLTGGGGTAAPDFAPAAKLFPAADPPPPVPPSPPPRRASLPWRDNLPRSSTPRPAGTEKPRRLPPPPPPPASTYLLPVAAAAAVFPAGGKGVRPQPAPLPSPLRRESSSRRSPLLCFSLGLHHPPYIAERAALVFTLAASPGLMSCY